MTQAEHPMRALPALVAAIAAAATLALGPAAAAQAPPQSPVSDAAEDGASTVVSELEVVARPQGPAMWRVKKGGSEVIILGAISPLPHSLAWDERRLERALDGARVLLTAPAAQVSLFDAPGLAIDVLRLRTKVPLDKRVPPATYARVLAAARTAQLDPAKIEGWKPSATGVQLVFAFEKAAGLSRAKPSSTVFRLARAHHVPTRPIASLKAAPLFSALLKQSEAHQIDCLEAAAAEVQWLAAHAQPAARAWAEGHVADARAHLAPSVFDRCVFELPSARALLNKGVADGVAAVEGELAKPGKAVAVVDLRYLTAANGLLDQLRARGAEITVPLLN